MTTRRIARRAAFSLATLFAIAYTFVVPHHAHAEQCVASFYGTPAENLTGALTASGEAFDPNAMTAAHKTLPFGTQVTVTNVDTGASVSVRINDRGPFVAGRCIDLTVAAFSLIGSQDAGLVNVNVEVAGGSSTPPTLAPTTTAPAPTTTQTAPSQPTPTQTTPTPTQPTPTPTPTQPGTTPTYSPPSGAPSSPGDHQDHWHEHHHH